MTAAEDGKPGLAEALAEAQAATPADPAGLAPSSRGGRNPAVMAIAKMCGEDPSEVLREFHGNTPLARTLRRLLGVDVPAPKLSAAERDYLLRCAVMKDTGLKGKALDDEVYRRVTAEVGPTGQQRRPSDPESVRKTAERGKRELRKRLVQSGFTELGLLFVGLDEAARLFLDPPTGGTT